MPLDTYKAVGHAMAAICSAVLLFAPFIRKYRDASRWLLSVWFIGSLFTLASNVFTLVRLSHFTYALATFVDTPSFIGGVGAGMLLAVVTSPEFRRRSARSRQASNQSLEPTTGRRDEQI